MAESQDNAMDSMASTAGRKRDFESIECPEMPGSDDPSNGGAFQSLRKRVKQSPKKSEAVSPDDSLTISTTSPSRGKPAPSDEGQSSNPLTETLTGYGAPSSIALVEQSAASAVISVTWNSGIQGGLRTSFAAKPQTSFTAMSSVGKARDGSPPEPTAPLNEEHLTVDMQDAEKPENASAQLTPHGADDDVVDVTIPSGQADGKTSDSTAIVSAAELVHVTPSQIKPAAWDTSRRMSRKQLEALSEEDRSAYEAAVGSQLRAKVAQRQQKAKHPQPLQGDLSCPPNNDDKMDEVDDATRSGAVMDISHRMLKKTCQVSMEITDTLSSQEKEACGNTLQVLDEKITHVRPQELQPQAPLPSNFTPSPFKVLSPQGIATLSTTDKEIDEATRRGQLESQKVVKLSNRERAKLSPNETKKYGEDLRDYTDRINGMRLEHGTVHADETLSLLQAWPLPKEYEDTMREIDQGSTYYSSREPRKPVIYKNNRVEFNLQSRPSNHRGIPIKAQDYSFGLFIPTFLQNNQDRLKELRPKELSAAFKTCVAVFYSHIPQAMREAIYSTVTAKSLKAAVQDASAINAAKSLMGSSELMTAPTKVKTEREIELENMEVELQRKYFPPTRDQPLVRRCLSCAGIGHRTMVCPALSCKLCGIDVGHSSSACPQARRCGKCRERGHQTSQCPEKLSRAEAEAIPCDICGSGGHIEENCHFIWRSFAPKPEEIRKVQSIPVHCYSCGGAGHYGPECGLYQGLLLSGLVTWSTANCQKYVDLKSQDRALSAGVDYTIKSHRKKNIFIKGKANDPITFDDSDDDVPEFIRPKVNPATQNGHIQFGSRTNLPTGPRQNESNPYRRGLHGPAQGIVQFPMRPANNANGGSSGRGRGGGNGARGGGMERGRERKRQNAKADRYQSR